MFREKEQEDRWIECVEEVLNRPPPEVAADIPPAEVDSEVSVDAPSKGEMISPSNLWKKGTHQGWITKVQSCLMLTQWLQQASYSNCSTKYGKGREFLKNSQKTWLGSSFAGRKQRSWLSMCPIHNLLRLRIKILIKRDPSPIIVP